MYNSFSTIGITAIPATLCHALSSSIKLWYPINDGEVMNIKYFVFCHNTRLIIDDGGGDDGK